MATLKTYQSYADKVAVKLGVTDLPVLRWEGGKDGCSLSKTTYAHCHIAELVSPRNRFPRGTICLNRSYFTKFSVKEWHHCLAHEVTHLAVKSDHHTPTFDRRMVALGVANDSERINARSARKGHHHLWGSVFDERPGEWHGYYSECLLCHKRERHNKS